MITYLKNFARYLSLTTAYFFILAQFYANMNQNKLVLTIGGIFFMLSAIYWKEEK